MTWPEAVTSAVGDAMRPVALTATVSADVSMVRSTSPVFLFQIVIGLKGRPAAMIPSPSRGDAGRGLPLPQVRATQAQDGGDDACDPAGRESTAEERHGPAL